MLRSALRAETFILGLDLRGGGRADNCQATDTAESVADIDATVSAKIREMYTLEVLALPDHIREVLPAEPDEKYIRKSYAMAKSQVESEISRRHMAHALHDVVEPETIAIWEVAENSIRDCEVLMGHTGRCVFPDDEDDNVARQLQGREHMKVETNGNGKCGLHAVFGKPSPAQELKVTDAAHLIRSILPTSLHELRQRLDLPGEVLLAKVLTKIWPEFVCSYFQHFSDSI